MKAKDLRKMLRSIDGNEDVFFSNEAGFDPCEAVSVEQIHLADFDGMKVDGSVFVIFIKRSWPESVLGDQPDGEGGLL